MSSRFLFRCHYYCYYFGPFEEKSRNFLIGNFALDDDVTLFFEATLDLFLLFEEES